MLTCSPCTRPSLILSQPAHSARAAFKPQRPRLPPCCTRVSAAAKPNTVGPEKLRRWEGISNWLTQRGDVILARPVEMPELLRSGDYILVDVRTPAEHAASHPLDAVNVPLFQAVNLREAGVVGLLRAALLKANGMKPLQQNPQFLAQLTQVAGDKGIIFVCETGGTLNASTNFPAGKDSRSLRAVYRVCSELKLSRVGHLAGGVLGWHRAQLPFHGEYDPSQAGRTSGAAEAPKGRFVEGRWVKDTQD